MDAADGTSCITLTYYESDDTTSYTVILLLCVFRPITRDVGYVLIRIVFHELRVGNTRLTVLVDNYE